MLPLFARAGLAMVPGRVAAAVRRRRRRGEFPTRRSSLSVETDRERLAAYDRVCGFPLSDTLPPT